MICRARSWTAGRNSATFTRSAFTLIEMVVVMVLVAMIAGAVVFSLGAPLQNARVKRVLASMEDADQRARMAARRSSESIELTIDSSKGVATQSASGHRQIKDERALAFSGGLHIDRFLRGGESKNEDRFTVRFGPSGQTETYAVRLSTNRNDQQSRHSWLVVVGATGQYIRSNEDSVVEAIVSTQR